MLGFPVIAAVFVLIMPEVAAEEWPKRFVWAHGSDHVYVVLYEDGVAAYSERKRRRGHSDWYFVASHARWAWCDESAAMRRQCLHLYVEGFSDQDQVSFRFDYWYEPSRITEFDEGGSQRVLRGMTLPRRVALRNQSRLIGMRNSKRPLRCAGSIRSLNPIADDMTRGLPARRIKESAPFGSRPSHGADS